VSFCTSDPSDLGPRMIARAPKNVKGRGIKTMRVLTNLDEGITWRSRRDMLSYS